MASHDHGGGGGVVGGVGKADVNFKDATGVSIDFGAAMKPDLGLAARFADNFHVAPSELMADAGAEGFADGLLGGEARGEMDVWFFHGLRISDFALEKDPPFRGIITDLIPITTTLSAILWMSLAFQSRTAIGVWW